jgi:hypothetical protein
MRLAIVSAGGIAVATSISSNGELDVFGPGAEQSIPLFGYIWIQRRGVACCIRQPLWRIRPDVKVVPVPPPVRKINSKGSAVLNARHAGNRGKSKRRLKTTPVFG